VLGQQLSLCAGIALAVFLSFTSGCASQRPTAAVESVEPRAGLVVVTDQEALLEPVALYGGNELSLGAVGERRGHLDLLLCDSLKREVDTAKPLILYLDGEHEKLRWQGGAVEDLRSCQRYEASIALLRNLADAKRAILRLYLLGGDTVEQRISGTMSDYLSRPKMHGPQRGFSRFLEAMSETSSAEMVVVE